MPEGFEQIGPRRSGESAGFYFGEQGEALRSNPAIY
jgi:hypothetical protein